MSDDVTLPGIGSVVATDDVSGKHYQRVKLDFGGDGATTPVTSSAGLPVTITAAASAATTSVSGAITTGGTAQNAAAANAARKGFWIQNNSSGDLWLSTLATAVQSQPSLRIPAGALYESPLGAAGTAAISIIGATTAQEFSGREW